MGDSNASKSENYKRIVAIASKRFRETGLAGFGIAEPMIDNYLNEAHRDNPGTGCAFSALAPEIARSDQRTRALSSEQVRNDIQLIAALHPAKDTRTATSIALRSSGRWLWRARYRTRHFRATS
jgi:TetR/AcrR family transcriptional regulator, transcriptional repressor for nem operon